MSVSYALTYTDNIEVTLVDCNLPSGSNFTADATVVSCIIKDKAENSDSCEFYVYLEDLVGPYSFAMNCSSVLNYNNLADFDTKVIDFLAR